MLNKNNPNFGYWYSQGDNLPEDFFNGIPNLRYEALQQLNINDPEIWKIYSEVVLDKINFPNVFSINVDNTKKQLAVTFYPNIFYMSQQIFQTNTIGKVTLSTSIKDILINYDEINTFLIQNVCCLKGNLSFQFNNSFNGTIAYNNPFYLTKKMTMIFNISTNQNLLEVTRLFNSQMKTMSINSPWIKLCNLQKVTTNQE